MTKPQWFMAGMVATLGIQALAPIIAAFFT